MVSLEDQQRFSYWRKVFAEEQAERDRRFMIREAREEAKRQPVFNWER
jgi:hypothetical protein